jgi:hypothetical protein
MGQRYMVSAAAREGFEFYWRGTPPRPWPRLSGGKSAGVLVEVADQDDDPDPQNMAIPPEGTAIRIGRLSWAELQADAEIRTVVAEAPAAAPAVPGSSEDSGGHQAPERHRSRKG